MLFIQIIFQEEEEEEEDKVCVPLLLSKSRRISPIQLELSMTEGY